jgi:hypothetical protein
MKIASPRLSVFFNTVFSEPLFWRFFVAASLFSPSVLLFYYGQNSVYVEIHYVLIISCLCILVSAVFFMLAERLLRNPFATFMLSILLWIGIFLESVAHLPIIKMFTSTVVFYVFWVALSSALSYVLRKVDVRGAFPFILCAFVFIFFSMSFGTSLYNYVQGVAAKKADVKTSFNVSESLSNQPNVYWIHCDGMINFKTCEKYFNDDQEDFMNELSEREFLVNEDASFFACYNTTVAIPALMCPDYYDNYLSDILSDRESAYKRVLSMSTQATLKDVRLHNETISAFTAAGYKTNTVALMNHFYFPSTDTFYYPLESEELGDWVLNMLYHHPFELAKMEQLSDEEAMECIKKSEASTFMLSFFRPGAKVFGFTPTSEHNPFMDYPVESEVLGASVSDEMLSELFLGSEAAARQYAYFVNAVDHILIDSSEERPHFTILMNLMFHFPFAFVEDGELNTNYSPEDMKLYYGQHVYSSKVLLNIVDMILKKDPDAVIVLQSDHGINYLYDDTLDASFELSNNDWYDMRHGTMSAIRVPEKYQNGEEAYAVSNPLNMSRYIVNNFVGRNYDYLQEES